MNSTSANPAVASQLRPLWAEELITFHIGRIARQFVLHFNINDFVFDMNGKLEMGADGYKRTGDIFGEMKQPVAIREYLHQFLFEALNCQAVYTYSLAGGLVANDRQQSGIGTPLGRELRGPAMQRLFDTSKTLRLTPQRRGGQPAEGQEVDLPDNIAANFKLLGHLLRQPYYDQSATLAQSGTQSRADNRTAPTQSTNTSNTKPMESPIAVILDYAEKLIPFNLDEGMGDREQLQALEVVQRWALDPLIRDTKNIIILLTSNIGQIPKSVYAEGSGCRAIRVPLPDANERIAFIRHAMRQNNNPRFVKLAIDPASFGQTLSEQVYQLARATQGMRLMDIYNITRRVYVEFYKNKTNRSTETPILRAEDVQSAKSEAIQAQSAELLEVVRPIRGFNEIGGLDSLKKYLRKRTALMKERSQSPLVPSGLLLAGPPGTGKTIIAEALALESGFNLVKMRSIQDKWIGSSERNLDLVINLLKDLHPVIVFIDEIDQAMVRRDTGQSGDGGVGARMFARILEEMSNAKNRGDILWVAATNRADIIDAALLRRFDRVVPLLTPDLEESCRIFAAMVSTIVKQSGENIKVVYGGDLAQSGHRDDFGRPDPTSEDLAKFLPAAENTSELGITGAGIEIIVRRSIEMAYEEMLDANVSEKDSSPVIELRHLQAAMKDFKPNYDRKTYDYQSLLAIRACNFYSVIPPLPKKGPFGRIQDPEGRVDSQKLEAEIARFEHPNS